MVFSNVVIIKYFVNPQVVAYLTYEIKARLVWVFQVVAYFTYEMKVRLEKEKECYDLKLCG